MQNLFLLHCNRIVTVTSNVVDEMHTDWKYNIQRSPYNLVSSYYERIFPECFVRKVSNNEVQQIGLNSSSKFLGVDCMLNDSKLKPIRDL